GNRNRPRRTFLISVSVPRLVERASAATEDFAAAERPSFCCCSADDFTVSFPMRVPKIRRPVINTPISIFMADSSIEYDIDGHSELNAIIAKSP
ncbi:MAG: hypothetical protein RLO18_27840, partial [Gimesia chilikensis]